MKIRVERVCTLAHADNIVLMAQGKKKLRNMFKRLENYLDKKKLMLNTRKTKGIRSIKERETLQKAKWK